jgi:predicted GNAT family N-acyltransferase
MYNIYHFRVQESPDLTQKALGIRKAVFIDEQKVDPDIEYENEEEAHHYLLTINNIPAATARWRETGKGIKLERFATLQQFRNMGLGTMILGAVMEDILRLKKTIYLHAQERAVSFYKKHGFTIKGDAFYEAEIKHFLMVYER